MTAIEPYSAFNKNAQKRPWLGRDRSQFKIQLFNSLLRLLPMAAKFMLTLYMGRFFSLENIGIYGLVLGTVLIITAVLGQRLDFIIVRDIVDVSVEKAVRIMRDGYLFYAANYLLLGLVIAAMIMLHVLALPPRIMIYILVLSILESAGTLVCENMIALGHQLTSNLILLLRSGVWVLPVIVLGMMNPAYRTADMVLINWSTGSALALVTTFWCWRKLPWRTISKLPYDWRWLREAVLKSSFYWLGMIGLIGGSFSDRFVINHYLNIDYVGILTFYSSFTNAMLTLMQSGVLVFSYPRLIAQHRNSDTQSFRAEVWRTARHMALGTTGITLLLALVVPIVAKLMHRDAFLNELNTFYLLLCGTWLRINAELFFYVLFARHQDKPLCYGNLLFIVPTLLASVIFVPLVGFAGIGYSCILSGVFLLVWRLWFARDLIRRPFPSSPEAG